MNKVTLMVGICLLLISHFGFVAADNTKTHHYKTTETEKVKQTKEVFKFIPYIQAKEKLNDLVDKEIGVYDRLYYYFPSFKLCFISKQEYDSSFLYVQINKGKKEYLLKSYNHIESADYDLLYYQNSKNKNQHVMIYWGDDYYGSFFLVFFLDEEKHFVELGSFYIDTPDVEEDTYQTIILTVFKTGNVLHIKTNKDISTHEAKAITSFKKTKELTYNLSKYCISC